MQPALLSLDVGPVLRSLDMVGLAVFAASGALAAARKRLDVIAAACRSHGDRHRLHGGVIRDVVAGVPSILLRHELYVTAALLLAGLYVGLSIAGVPAPWPMLIAVPAGFLLRGAAILWGLAMPPHRG